MRTILSVAADWGPTRKMERVRWDEITAMNSGGGDLDSADGSAAKVVEEVQLEDDASATLDAPDWTAPRTGSTAGVPDPDALERGQRWILAAGVLFGCSGTANLIGGILVLAGSHASRTGIDYILTHDLDAAGWTVILLGVVQCFAALLIWTGARAGQGFGIAVCVIGIVGAFQILSAQPIWAAIVLVVNVLVIYGLVTYGSRADLIT